MAKQHKIFICEACGHESYKWLGKCPTCAGWDTLKEMEVQPGPRHVAAEPTTLVDEDVEEERIILGMDEMDRVLGGGLTRGSSILMGGDPGIGKTTLSFELASRLTEMGHEVLYVSGEESARQLAGRRRRLGLKGPFPLLVTNHLDDILDAARKKAYSLIIIDSIQSVYNSNLAFLPGSMTQVRDVSSRLIREFKEREITHILIGHVTKEGTIAGPRILEHMVDTVLYFEGDRVLPYRMLRAIKNRYGPVDEIGLFQMTKEGLVSAEPSLLFMNERSDTSSGSTLFPYVTGSRPLVLEIQSITAKTAFPIPKKLSIGYDVNRLFIMAAVIEKFLSIPFYDRDIYVNVTGGIKVTEPAIDLSVAAAILSAYRNKAWGNAAFFGEVGLTGEVRRTVNMDMRIRECERLKIERVFCPKGTETSGSIRLFPVKSIRDLHDHLS